MRKHKRHQDNGWISKQAEVHPAVAEAAANIALTEDEVFLTLRFVKPSAESQVSKFYRRLERTKEMKASLHMERGL